MVPIVSFGHNHYPWAPLSHSWLYMVSKTTLNQLQKSRPVNPSIQQCTGSVEVWLLGGLIKCNINWPSVTLWLVFANPVTYIVQIIIDSYVQLDWYKCQLLTRRPNVLIVLIECNSLSIQVTTWNSHLGGGLSWPVLYQNISINLEKFS